MIKGVISTHKVKANDTSWSGDHLYNKHRHKSFDYIMRTNDASVTNSILYVDQARYSSEGKIVLAERL